MSEVRFDNCLIEIDNVVYYALPTKLVDYVKKLYENNKSYQRQIESLGDKLAENTESDIEIIENVYKYICDNIEYDTEKAKIIKKIYNPDLDEILTNKKGICFDYASLAAGMLRSQGIPTKLVMGYLGPDDLYHAWNMVYTKENGWELFDFADKTNGNNILLKSEKVYKELYEY